MNRIHCSHSYHQLAHNKVETFAEGIIEGFYGNNPPFTVQPKTQAEYEALIATYELRRVAYEKGGSAQKGDFLIAETALMEATDSIAQETDKVAKGDKEIIILAGFEPTKEDSEGTKPGQCVVTVKRGMAGELIPTCAVIENAKHYGCIMTEGAPLPEGVIITASGRIVWNGNEPMPPSPPASPGMMFTGLQLDLTMQREKHFTDLKHDVTYYFYYYAVNATGVGPLSEVVSIVCW